MIDSVQINQAPVHQTSQVLSQEQFRERINRIRRIMLVSLPCIFLVVGSLALAQETCVNNTCDEMTKNIIILSAAFGCVLTSLCFFSCALECFSALRLVEIRYEQNQEQSFEQDLV